MNTVKFAFVVVLLCQAIGCTSVPIRFPALEDKKSYKVVGRTEGTGGGFLLLDFIPLGSQGRFKRAYESALRRSAADAIINPEISDSYYWIYIGTIQKASVKGDAIIYSSSVEHDLEIPVAKASERAEDLVLSKRNFPQKSLAIADLTVLALSQNEVMSLTEKLRNTIVDSDYFQVLSQSDMKNVLTQQRFQKTDVCDDTTCLVEMGKILSVEKMLGGSVGRVGNTFTIVLRIISVETAKIEITVEDQYRGESDDLLEVIGRLGNKLSYKYAEKQRSAEQGGGPVR